MWRGLSLAICAAAFASAAFAQSWHVTLTDSRDQPLACPGVQNMHECATIWEAKVSRERAGLVARLGGRLRVTLLDGEQRPLWGQCAICFVLVALSADERFAIIREQYGEGNTWHVLDRKNGRLTLVDGYPLFSPDGKTFVAIQTDLDAQYSATLMDVYDASGATPRRVFKTLTDEESWSPEWGPASVYWCDNATIAFQRAVGEAYVKSDTLEALVLRNGRWRMEASAPDRCRSKSP